MAFWTAAKNLLLAEVIVSGIQRLTLRTNARDGQRRRGLRIFLLLLRARLPVFLRDLPGLFLALPHERFQILPAIADDQPQPGKRHRRVAPFDAGAYHPLRG